MHRLLQSDHFTIQSKIRWFPSLNTKFQLVDDDNKTIGEIVFHPAWMAPVLWLFGLLFEIGLIGGGVALVVTGADSTQKLIGIGLAVLGLLFLLLVNFRSFLASRASSSIEVSDESGSVILQARKGWAIWRPTFTVWNTQDDRQLGQSRQSFLWGDRHYTIWDAEGNDWGSIRRRPFGFQYRVRKGSKQVARFRRKLIDARKMITGVRSYLLEYEDTQLTEDERALILGSLAYADVLVRQKKLREEKDEKQTSTPKKK